MCRVGVGYPTGVDELDGFTFTIPDPPIDLNRVVSPDVAVQATKSTGPDTRGGSRPTCYLLMAAGAPMRDIPPLTKISGRTVTPTAEPIQTHLVWAVVIKGIPMEAAGPISTTANGAPSTGTGIWFIDARSGHNLAAMDFGG